MANIWPDVDVRHMRERIDVEPLVKIMRVKRGHLIHGDAVEVAEPLDGFAVDGSAETVADEVQITLVIGQVVASESSIQAFGYCFVPSRCSVVRGRAPQRIDDVFHTWRSSESRGNGIGT